jgi:hypothetical protein
VLLYELKNNKYMYIVWTKVTFKNILEDLTAFFFKSEYESYSGYCTHKSQKRFQHKKMLINTVRNNVLCFLIFFNVVRTVHFGMKLYNDHSKAQVFNLVIYLLLPETCKAEVNR